jgi:hypothetical protein
MYSKWAIHYLQRNTKNRANKNNFINSPKLYKTGIPRLSPSILTPPILVEERYL